jgi:hypothetical protein
VERVIFINERTGERIACLLNPEALEFRRTSGIRARTLAGGKLVGGPSPHDPIFAAGGGRTEFTLDLLFDVELVQPRAATQDVRELTRPLWQATQSEAQTRLHEPPSVLRFLWGRSWNIPAVVVALSERLDRFNLDGVPTRSWLRAEFVEVDEAAASAVRPEEMTLLAGELWPDQQEDADAIA